NYDRRAVTTARQSSHTYSIAAATYWSSWLNYLLGDLDAAAEKADSAIRMGDEYGYVTPGLSARWIKASILIRRNAIEEGVEEFDRLLTKVAVWPRFAMVRLSIVDTALRCGRIKEGLDLIADAFAQMQTCGDRGSEAEFHRLKGELLLRREANKSEAEKS